MSRTLNIAGCRRISARLLLTAALLLLGANPTITTARLNSDYFPNVPLINQDGKTLHFYDDVIKGKVVSINFMFTSCGDSCPLETAKLRELQKRLGEFAGKDVFMYSITVDPKRDTPPVLKAYMEKFEVGPGWEFLTGKKEDIDLIRKKLGMYLEGEDELSDHNINFILGNETTGQWMKKTPFDVPESLVATLLGRLQKRPLGPMAKLDSYANAPTVSRARPGEELFVTRCSACHTIGKGDKLGPDLFAVASNRDRLWLMRWLQEPDVMLAEKDPLAMALYTKYNNVPMPNLQLQSQDILDLITYMQEETQRVRATALGVGPRTNKLEKIAPAKPVGRSGTAAGSTKRPGDQARAETAPVNSLQ